MGYVIPWWIVENTLLAALLALLVALVSRCRRVPPVVRHGLWLVVLIKLIVPPVFSLEIAVPARWDLVTREANAFGERDEHEPGVLEVGERQIRLDPPAETNSRRIGARPPLAGANQMEPEPDMAGPDTFVPVDDSQSVVLFATGDTETPREESAETQPLQRPTSAADRPVALTVSPAMLLYWSVLTGTLVANVIQCARLIRIRRLLNRTVCPPEEFTNLVVEIAAGMKIRPPAVLVSTEIHSPFVCALGRPVLVWPASGLVALRDSARRAVIVHELAHLARRDHWIGWVELVASCGWWWNPLFWYVRHQLHENAELACDAWATELCPEARRAYASALVDLAELDSWKTATVPALGVGDGSRKLFERRLVMIMGDRVRHRMGAVGFIGMGLLVLAALPGCSAGFAAEDPVPADSLPAQSNLEPAPAALADPGIQPFDPFKDSDAVRSSNPTLADPVPAAALPESLALPLDEPAPIMPPTARGQDPTASNDDRLKRLEDRLESLLTELRELKSSSKNPPDKHDPNVQPEPKKVSNAPQEYRKSFTTATSKMAKPVTPQVETVTKTPLNMAIKTPQTITFKKVKLETVTLMRTTYELPPGKADEIAAFFKASLTDEIEVRVKGDSLIVTANPDDQTPIAAFIHLLQTRGAASPRPGAKGPVKQDDNAPVDAAPKGPTKF